MSIMSLSRSMKPRCDLYINLENLQKREIFATRSSYSKLARSHDRHIRQKWIIGKKRHIIVAVANAPPPVPADKGTGSVPKSRHAS